MEEILLALRIWWLVVSAAIAARDHAHKAFF
jgi:hypothetical protein